MIPRKNDRDGFLDMRILLTDCVRTEKRTTYTYKNILQFYKFSQSSCVQLFQGKVDNQNVLANYKLKLPYMQDDRITYQVVLKSKYNSSSFFFFFSQFVTQVSIWYG